MNSNLEAASNGIRALGENSKLSNRKMIALLFDDIEFALSKGATQTQIIEELEKHGIYIKQSAFSLLMAQLRTNKSEQ